MMIRIKDGDIVVSDREEPGLSVISDGTELMDEPLISFCKAADRAKFVSDRTNKAPPCALCGGSPRFFYDRKFRGSGYVMMCTKCGIQTGARLTMNQALNEWTYIMTRAKNKEEEE